MITRHITLTRRKRYAAAGHRARNSSHAHTAGARNHAMDLASREGSVIYTQQRCMDGAAISKAYGTKRRARDREAYIFPQLRN